MPKINAIKHKLPTTHEEWLNNRLAGIGGSDAGAVLGINKYKSPYALWCEKTGRIKNNIDNERMRFGRDMEEYVSKRFEEATGKKVRKSGFSFQSKEYPFMLANVDRLVVGEDAGLEIKTTSEYNKKTYDAENIPPEYYAQCMHYMAVTGLSKWYIAIYIPGVNLYIYEVLRDKEEIGALINAESTFWSYVENDQEPPIDGSDSTAEALYKLHPESMDDVLNMTSRQDELKRYIELKDKIKELEGEKKEFENTFKHDLGDCELGFTDSFKISWKSQKRNSVDSKKLKTEFPEIYNHVLKTSSSRVFTIKEI